MAGKIPAEAFDYYFSLGPGRSYQAVADRYQVTKKAVTNRALKESWQDRTEEIERKAQSLAAEKTAESLGDVRARHGKIIKAIQGKAIEALKAMPIDSGMDAIRALDIALRLERGHSPSEGEASAPAKEDTREFTISKFIRESPIWVSDLVARADHWGSQAGEEEKRIRALVGELCAWVDGLVSKFNIDPVIPFHVTVLLAFLVETNNATAGRMRQIIYQLEAELEAVRKERKVECNEDWGWRTLAIRRPRTSEEGWNAIDTLTWRETFGTDCLDPITFISQWLRQRNGEE